MVNNSGPLIDIKLAWHSFAIALASKVFYHSIEQKLTAEKIKEAFNASKVFDAPVITGVEPASEFYKAEDYHQNYFRENGEQPYCRAVVRPKVEKFEKLFRDLVR